MRSLRGAELVIASHNRGKIAEFSRLLAPLAVKLVAAADLGLPEPVEDGATFSANAEIKARAIARASGKIALADDSGLAVSALGGEPGIHSARWAGPERDFGFAMRKVEDALAGQSDRDAKFITVLALCWPDGACEFFTGEVAGQLIWPPCGEGGFGYDPIFVPDGGNRTFAEMTADEKARFSHRGKACGAFVKRYMA
ncbi:MAG: RdgB/HAM1 family non-canonical purine NTP pyrophosphatase [Alphaproteobacteria bacterium]